MVVKLLAIEIGLDQEMAVAMDLAMAEETAPQVVLDGAVALAMLLAIPLDQHVAMELVLALDQAADLAVDLHVQWFISTIHTTNIHRLHHKSHSVNFRFIKNSIAST